MAIDSNARRKCCGRWYVETRIAISGRGDIREGTGEGVAVRERYQTKLSWRQKGYRRVRRKFAIRIDRTSTAPTLTSKLPRECRLYRLKIVANEIDACQPWTEWVIYAAP
jgi:hypothetical protein